MSERRRVLFRVSGRVQGVGFRYFVEARARSLGVSGWVRNRPDGSVEVLAEGDDAALEALRAAVRRGPPGASVADIAETVDTDASTLPLGFVVRRDHQP